MYCKPGGFVRADFVWVREKGRDFNRTTVGCGFRSHNLCGAQIIYFRLGLFGTGWYLKPVSPIH